MVVLATLTPIERVSFRWYGTSSPLARGPMTSLISEPVPLPTTVAGALYTAMGGSKVGMCVDLDRLTELFKERVKCDKGSFGGPYVLIHEPGSPDNWAAVCFHSLNKGLLCVDKGRQVFSLSQEEMTLSTVGISLRNATKTVIESMMYSQTTTDFKALALAAARKLGRGLLEASVAVELSNCYPGKPARSIIPFGGEGFLAKVRFMDVKESPLNSLKEMTRHYDQITYVAATPCIIEGKLVGETQEPLKLLTEIAHRLGIRPEDIVTSKTTITVGITPTGYDTASNMPRPLKPAIMPGSLITTKNQITKDPGPLGYCTMAPIPTSLLFRR